MIDTLTLFKLSGNFGELCSLGFSTRSIAWKNSDETVLTTRNKKQFDNGRHCKLVTGRGLGNLCSCCLASNV